MEQQLWLGKSRFSFRYWKWGGPVKKKHPVYWYSQACCCQDKSRYPVPPLIRTKIVLENISISLPWRWRIANIVCKIVIFVTLFKDTLAYHTLHPWRHYQDEMLWIIPTRETFINVKIWHLCMCAQLSKWAPLDHGIYHPQILLWH